MSSTKDVKYVKYGNRTEEEWNALQEERRPEVYELLNKLGYNHKADVANLKVYQTANGFDIQDGITDQVYGAIRRDAALKGVLTNNEGSTIPPSAPASDSATNYSDYTNLSNYANDYKSSAYANASALRGASYEAALKARQEAEALAEIQRKRGIVDASTMAEQQKATYGANAEQLGRMGLNVSGYSDYLNSQAYASGMAARQNANAQATDIKRQATYQEALARLEADKAYSQATAEADKTYYGTMSEIALQQKADADARAAALKAEEQAKTQAQQTAYSNVINAIYNNAGELTEADVEVLAKANNITDANTIDELKKYATTYASAIGADTEDTKPEKYEGYANFSEIDKAYNELDISEEEMKDHKERLNQNSVNQVNTFISQGDIAGASAKADELYDANQMTKETYQATKAELAQKNIEGIESIQDVHTVAEDLKKMLKKEEITKEEYNKKISAMSSKAKGIINYGNVNMSGIKVSKGTTTDSSMRIISIDGNDYSVKLNTAPSRMKSVLENERPKTATITEYDGKYYLYDTIKKNWFVVTPYVDPSYPRATNNAFYDKIKAKVK